MGESAIALLIEALREKGELKEPHEIIKLSEKLMEKNTPQAVIDFYLARGRYLLLCGDVELSLKNYQAALEEAREIGDASREVLALSGLAALYLEKNEPGKAQEAAYAAQTRAFEGDTEPHLQAKSFEACRAVESVEKNYDAALRNILSARSLYRLTGNRRCEADALLKNVGSKSIIHNGTNIRECHE